MSSDHGSLNSIIAVQVLQLRVYIFYIDLCSNDQFLTRGGKEIFSFCALWFLGDLVNRLMQSYTVCLSMLNPTDHAFDCRAFLLGICIGKLPPLNHVE